MHIYIYRTRHINLGTCLSSILGVEPSKRRSYPIKARFIWVSGIGMQLNFLKNSHCPGCATYLRLNQQAYFCEKDVGQSADLFVSDSEKMQGQIPNQKSQKRLVMRKFHRGLGGSPLLWCVLKQIFFRGFIGFMQSFPPVFSRFKKKLRGFAFVDEFKNDCVPRNKHLPIYSRWVMVGLSVRFGEQKLMYVHFGMKEVGG